MNGQQAVQIDGDTATGIAYCQVKLVSEEDGKEVITIVVFDMTMSMCFKMELG
jgi:hypothetical protein